MSAITQAFASLRCATPDSASLPFAPPFQCAVALHFPCQLWGFRACHWPTVCLRLIACHSPFPFVIECSRVCIPVGSLSRFRVCQCLQCLKPLIGLAAPLTTRVAGARSLSSLGFESAIDPQIVRGVLLATPLRFMAVHCLLPLRVGVADSSRFRVCHCAVRFGFASQAFKLYLFRACRSTGLRFASLLELGLPVAISCQV